MVHVAYLTDPLCPWSWAAEPQLRRLEVEFAASVRFTYVMAGTFREVDPRTLLTATLDAVADSGMPADPRIWLRGEPRSSHPACMAVEAAAEQGLAAPYLRRLRVGAMCRRERLDGVEGLVAAARDVAGLRLDRFEIDLRSNAIVEAFAADRDRVAAAFAGHGEPEVPALVVGDGAPLTEPDRWRDAVLAAGAEPGERPGVEDALRRLGPAGAPEIASLCDLGADRARMELWRLAGEFRARPARLVCGELWERAG